MPRRKMMRHSEEWWELIAPPTAVRCEGHTQDGHQCRRESIFGSTVCYQHGGAAGHVQRAAAARIGNMADEMVKRLFAMLDDPETPHAVRSKIMQDLLDRAGLNATEKHIVGIGPADPIEKFFRDLAGVDGILAPAQVERSQPSAQALAWNREVMEGHGDIVEGEVIEEPERPAPLPSPARTKPMGTKPPKHIREGLERAEALERLI